MTGVPMGPALEGIGLTFGEMADSTVGKGTVHRLTLSPAGLSPLTLAHDAPQRLCGTGYLSLIANLLKTGIIDKQGLFRTESSLPLFRSIAKN